MSFALGTYLNGNPIGIIESAGLLPGFGLVPPHIWNPHGYFANDPTYQAIVGSFQQQQINSLGGILPAQTFIPTAPNGSGGSFISGIDAALNPLLSNVLSPFSFNSSSPLAFGPQFLANFGNPGLPTFV